MCQGGHENHAENHHETHSARDQNARNPGIPDGFGQFSMVWGKFLIDLKPAASRISRVMVPKYFLVVSKFVVATRKCCRMQVGNNNSYCRGILVLRRCKTTQTVAKNVWRSILSQGRPRPAGFTSKLVQSDRKSVV